MRLPIAVRIGDPDDGGVIKIPLVDRDQIVNLANDGNRVVVYSDSGETWHLTMVLGGWVVIAWRVK